MSPIAIFEDTNSRRLKYGRQSSLDLSFCIIGAVDEKEAKASLLDAAPPAYGSWYDPPYLLLQGIAVDPEGDKIWRGTASYAPLEYDAPPEDEDVFAFDTTGGSMHITQALAQRTYVAEGENAPDFQGAIGVTRDGVEGVDITIPVFAFSETHSFDAITQAYKLAVRNLTGRVNNATFRGFAAGEVLFLGASGERRGNRLRSKWEISFKFSAQENEENIQVGSIAVASKLGWEYLWARYEDVKDDESQTVLKRATSVSVAQIYKSGDFSALLI